MAFRSCIARIRLALVPAYRVRGEGRAWWKSYSRYLRSARWQCRRKAILWRDRRRCRVCGGHGTEAHHLTYENVGDELQEDLITLCGPCHDRMKNERR